MLKPLRAARRFHGPPCSLYFQRLLAQSCVAYILPVTVTDVANRLNTIQVPVILEFFFRTLRYCTYRYPLFFLTDKGFCSGVGSERDELGCVRQSRIGYNVDFEVGRCHQT